MVVSAKGDLAALPRGSQRSDQLIPSHIGGAYGLQAKPLKIVLPVGVGKCGRSPWGCRRNFGDLAHRNVQVVVRGGDRHRIAAFDPGGTQAFDIHGETNSRDAAEIRAELGKVFPNCRRSTPHRGLPHPTFPLFFGPAGPPPTIMIFIWIYPHFHIQAPCARSTKLAGKRELRYSPSSSSMVLVLLSFPLDPGEGVGVEDGSEVEDSEEPDGSSV